MIPSAVNVVLVVFGLGMLTLSAGTWLRLAPSIGRFEKVVTFAAIGLVSVAVGTALVCKDLIGPRKDDLGETFVVATAFGCLGFCVVGYPLLHYLAVRRRGRRAPASQDFAEDGRGNPIQSEGPPTGSEW